MKRVPLLITIAATATLAAETFDHYGVRWTRVAVNLQDSTEVWKFRDGPVTCYVLEAARRMDSPSLSCVVPK